MIINAALAIIVVLICIGLVMAAPFIAMVLLGIAFLLGALGIGAIVFAILQDINPNDPKF